LGEGGQGWVFRATWNGSVDVVVKVLRPDTATDEALARFRREAQVLRTLSQHSLPNPHIVRFYDHAYVRVELAASRDAWDLPFTVLELVDGETLEQALVATHPRGLALDRARRILRHVVLALEAVHAHGVVHRDLKPSNILLARSSGREIAKVTDFGIAKLLAPGMQSTTQLAGATVGYAPPEQFENGNPRVGRATDVFSLAAIFYEMVTGLPAFPVPPNAHPYLVLVRQLNEAPPAFRSVRDRLPRELAGQPQCIALVDAELARALAPEPSARHASATEFFEAIEGALIRLGNTPSIPPRPSAGPIVIRPSAPPSTESPALADTLHAESPRASAPPGDAPTPESLAWRCLTAPLTSRAFRAISVAPTGEIAAGLGSRGPAWWHQGRWMPLDVPTGVDAATIRVAAWYGERLLMAGAAPIVLGFEPGRPPAVWPIDSPGVCFKGLSADGAGTVLAGERATASGPVGVVGELPLAPRGHHRWGLVEVAGARGLGAVVRVSGIMIACGDDGVIAAVRAGVAPRVVHACAPPLVALADAGDGSAVAVGGGGFVFTVRPDLTFRLEAVQTTRDLFTVTRAPDGTMWCAGDGGRILRRRGENWARVPADGVEARVLALRASSARVLAFCDDGSVFEGIGRA
jgi:serine/threonine-protein kinase